MRGFTIVSEEAGGGQGWIRTSVRLHGQIYSLPKTSPVRLILLHFRSPCTVSCTVEG